MHIGELLMILELHCQGLSIADRLGVDRKTIRKYITRGLEPPCYGWCDRLDSSASRHREPGAELIAELDKVQQQDVVHGRAQSESAHHGGHAMHCGTAVRILSVDYRA